MVIAGLLQLSGPADVSYNLVKFITKSANNNLGSSTRGILSASYRPTGYAVQFPKIALSS